MTSDTRTSLAPPHAPPAVTPLTRARVVGPLTRRTVLASMGFAAAVPLLPVMSRAQSSSQAAMQLPLKTTGLEHMGTVVPDVAAAGKFYGRLFNPDLYKEKDDPLRYYVTLGVGYLALGSRANQPRAFFDHFCALVQDYDAPAMAEQLKAEGLPAGRFGIIPDPDGLGLQLLGVPGGLAKSTVPAGRIVEEDALVRPIGLDQVVLRVADLEKSLQFYRKFFGMEASKTGKEAWFQVANTRLGLEALPSTQKPSIDRIRVKVQHFDRRAVSRELTKLGAKVDSRSAQTLSFRDPLDLGIELLPV